MVAVCKNVVLRHPETEERPKQNQSWEHEVEMPFHQVASQTSGQQVCYKLQSAVQEPEEELSCLYQLCGHLVQLLQVDVWCGAPWEDSSLQIHVFLGVKMPFWLCAHIQFSSSLFARVRPTAPSLGSSYFITARRAAEHMVYKNTSPLSSVSSRVLPLYNTDGKWRQ